MKSNNYTPSHVSNDYPTFHQQKNDKKRAAIIQTWQSPIWQKLSLILLTSMLVLAAAMALVELKNYLHYPSLGIHGLLINLSITLLTIWGIYAVLLGLCCVMGSLSNSKSYYKNKAQSGIVDTTEDERKRSRRAVRRINMPYRKRMLIGFIGLVALAIFYFLVHAF